MYIHVCGKGIDFADSVVFIVSFILLFISDLSGYHFWGVQCTGESFHGRNPQSCSIRSLVAQKGEGAVDGC